MAKNRNGGDSVIKRYPAVVLAVCLVLSLLIPVRAAEETTVPETIPEETEPETMFSSPYHLYFGLLHAHTNLSDGQGSVDEAFSYAAQVENLDFFAVTDHSNSLDETEWAAGNGAAQAVTTEDFLGLFGYEMTWQETQRIGHIVTLGTDGFLSRDQEEYSNPATALEAYYRTLTGLPGSVSMLCHPGKFYGDFHSFGHYSWEYDRSVQLLEVLSGQEAPSWEQYTKALDAGWHLAPSANQNNHNGFWGDASSVRTVVLADSLTEASLFDAIRNRRVYATEDSDLHLYYDLDGQIMGSILSRADNPEITLLAYDPTDEAIGTVEVVTEGGLVLATETGAKNDVYLTISAPCGYRYYYLRITQPDGHRAVTAPVWVEGFEDMGILEFTANTDRPVQDQLITLTLSIYNNEAAALSLESVTLYADDLPVSTVEAPGSVPAYGELTLSIPYTHSLSGETELTVLVQGSVCGESRSYEASLPLRFRSGVAVTGVLVDGSHENAGLDHLERFCVMTEEAGQELTLVTGDLPQGGNILLIPDPKLPLGVHFLQDVRALAEAGGDLILWGTPEILTPLLDALELTIRFGTTTVEAASAQCFNTASPWCGGLVSGQYVTCPEGTAVEPGSGTWLIRKTTDGPVLLACEETAWGGTVFLSGCSFLLDEQMPESRSVWELPRAGETILRTILGEKQSILTRQPIQTVRTGAEGETYRIKGYVTAGTSNPHTTFPDTIYLQDETGGIAVTGFFAEGIQIGAPMEIIGTLSSDGENTVLEYETHQLLREDYYRWVPNTLGCKTATDYRIRGGSLVQVEGRVTELTRTEDNLGIARLVITDFRGEKAVIEIEDGIFSGATGENRLAEDIRKGRTFRTMGLLHINEAGETVIRVRNCDEVVYVPPKTDLSNPDTSDRAWFWP